MYFTALVVSKVNEEVAHAFQIEEGPRLESLLTLAGFLSPVLPYRRSLRQRKSLVKRSLAISSEGAYLLFNFQ